MVRKHVVICFAFLSKYTNNFIEYVLLDANNLNKFFFDIVALAD